MRLVPIRDPRLRVVFYGPPVVRAPRRLPARLSAGAANRLSSVIDRMSMTTKAGTLAYRIPPGHANRYSLSNRYQ